jgi:hypothetical protein
MLEGASSNHSGADALLQAATLTSVLACVATGTTLPVANIFEGDHVVPNYRFASMATGTRIEFWRGHAQAGVRPVVQGTIVALLKNSVRVKFPEDTGRTYIQKERFEIDFIRELSEGEPFAQQIVDDVHPRLPAPSMHLRSRSEPAAAPSDEEEKEEEEEEEEDRSLLPAFSSLGLGDRLEFWVRRKTQKVLHRGSIVTLNRKSVVLEYEEDDTASRMGVRRTHWIHIHAYSRWVHRRLSPSEAAAEAMETFSASGHDLRSRAERSEHDEQGAERASSSRPLAHQAHDDDGHIQDEDEDEDEDEASHADDDHDAAADDHDVDDGTDCALDSDDEETVLIHGIEDASGIEVTLDDTEQDAAGPVGPTAQKKPVSSGALEQGGRFMSEIFETAARAHKSRSYYDFPVHVSSKPSFRPHYSCVVCSTHNGAENQPAIHYTIL